VKGNKTVFAGALCAACLVISAAARTQTPHSACLSSEISLGQFVQSWNGGKPTPYVAAVVDLDGTGTPEAIVHLTGREWCGTGGCNTLILRQDKCSWKIVTNITLTTRPIRVLARTSHGWRNVVVGVQGGGLRAYEAELMYDGTTYPRNPTLPPARPLKGSAEGTEVIPAQ
jgi:hypothetical protein